MFEKVKKFVRGVVGPSIEDENAEAVRELREALEAKASAYVTVPEGYVTVKRDDLESLATTLKLEKQKSVQYFDLIERVIAQRDERWEMFLTHSTEHQYAQAALEETIIGLRQMLANAVKELNQYREKAGVTTITRPIDLLGVPIGTADEFSRHMKKLKESASATIDGKAERDRIAALLLDDSDGIATGHVDDGMLMHDAAPGAYVRRGS